MRSARTVILLAAFAVLAAIIPAGLRAQSQVQVTLFQPPPNQLKVADFWRIRLVNNTQAPITICLFGRLRETNLDKVLVEATTTRFVLAPGTHMITGAEIQPIDAHYFDNKYKDVFIRTGSAPTGSYEICVEVRRDCNDGDVIGRDCKNAEVQQATPPVLISPPDESIVEDKLPVFSWMPPSPLKRGQQIRYRLKIVEIVGRQTPFDAMQSNPAWFDRPSITPTVFQFPISSRPFTTGRKYAWKVSASDGDFPLGESEIWWFAYQPRKLDADGGTDFDPLSGGLKNRVFIDSAFHGKKILTPTMLKTFDRGVSLIGLTEKATDFGIVRGNIDSLIVGLKPTIPPAILKELLHSCDGQ
ncbi:MAG: hypothetical protein ABI876_02620 [Bacteroidota bacterium]